MPEAHRPGSGADDGSAAPPSPGPATGPKIGVRGDFADRLSHVSGTSLSLLSCIGYTDDNAPVLLPLVDFGLRGTPGEGDQPLFARILTLDNFAEMLAELSNDLGSACQELGLLGHDRLGPEPGRLARIVRLVEHMRGNLDACLGSLAEIGPGRR